MPSASRLITLVMRQSTHTGQVAHTARARVRPVAAVSKKISGSLSTHAARARQPRSVLVVEAPSARLTARPGTRAVVVAVYTGWNGRRGGVVGTAADTG
ncbi:hypothetical protein JCM18899A_40680 [Nocardioides sp. AN3]